MKKVLFLFSLFITQIYSLNALAESKVIESNFILEFPNAKYEHQIKIERVSGFSRKYARPVDGTQYTSAVYITLEGKSEFQPEPFKLHFSLYEPKIELYPLSRFVPSFLESEEQQKMQLAEMQRFYEFALAETAKLKRVYVFRVCGANTHEDGISGGCYNRNRIGGDVGWAPAKNPDSVIGEGLYLDSTRKTLLEHWLVEKWRLLKILETNRATAGDVERQLQQLNALASGNQPQ